MRIFLMMLILLAMVTTAMADTLNRVHVKMPTSNNVTKIHGELLEDTPNDCKSGIALVFKNKHGFRENLYMGSGVGFQDLKSVKFMLTYRPGNEEITFCIPEAIFNKGSFEYNSGIVESIFLWSPSDIPLVRGYMKDLEGTNSSVTTKESVLTDPIFWLLMLVLAVLAGYEFKNYKERQRRLKRKK